MVPSGLNLYLNFGNQRVMSWLPCPCRDSLGNLPVVPPGSPVYDGCYAGSPPQGPVGNRSIHQSRGGAPPSRHRDAHHPPQLSGIFILDSTESWDGGWPKETDAGLDLSVGPRASFVSFGHTDTFHGYSLWLRLCQIKIACEAETLSCRGRVWRCARPTGVGARSRRS